MKNFIPFSYEIKDLTGKGLVTFIANAFNNVDSDYDISLPGSFKKTLKERGKKLRHFKNHDMRLMPGVVVEAKEVDIGLQITSQLILETQIGKETYEEYKALAEADKQMEHSVGVSAVKYEMDEEKDIRTVSEWKLYEVSTLNAWGANPDALTQNIKSLEDADNDDILREIIFLRGLLNIKSYDDIKLDKIEQQINYLNKLKAALGAADQHSESRTFEEWRKMLNIK